jgi:signal transduction histidine kinase/DNA-binding response OmpR family regulator
MKNMKIGTQLILGFAVLLFFVIILGVISYIQSDRISLQTEYLYNHPLQVRSAIGQLRADILSIRVDMKDLVLTSDAKEIAYDLKQMEIRKNSGFEQLDIFYDQYLGPRADIDSVKQAFIAWNSVREETIRLLQAGEKQEAADRTRIFSIGGMAATETLTALQKIDDFAQSKANQLYQSSIDLKTSLNRQLILLVALMVLLSLLISYVLLRNIRKPLSALYDATNRFHSGDMDARSWYTSGNEFGALSNSFNTLAAGIQADTELNQKVVSLSGMMLSTYEAKAFFRETIDSLAVHTGSQMAAIYLLSDDKKYFEHFESTGIDNAARQSFAAGTLEGEFGAVLTTRKVQHLRNIPENTRFIFHTVSGKFIPREIVTIPIVANSEVVAIISLASINEFGKRAIQLIDSILSTLSARVEGILAYHKMREFSEKLENQNRELESQKTELVTQSVELAQQNSELEIQQKQLHEVSRLKTNFLSNMSHELRTPLNSVIALTGVLSHRLVEKIPPEEYSYLEVIERNGKHLLSLINDILDISRIEAGYEEVEISTFNLCNLVNEVVSMIEPQAKQKNIELLKAVGDCDGFISSDAGKCRHILQNLIGNAVKFTEKGQVNIEARYKGKKVAITVTDTGIGIADSHLEHIFDEFRQADGSTSRRFGGTGLGLAIAKKYANLLGGTITVSSEFGKGSAFTLTLPLSYAAENRISEVESVAGLNYQIKTAPQQPLSGTFLKTILLVDDSEPAIIQLKDILAESGFNLLVARDGAEALGILSHSIPDAMILDLMMPGIDGFEVLKTIREVESTAHIPVLILTAKHITKEELSFLTRNNIHQLIQKGDVKRVDLMNAVASMVFPGKVETENLPRELQTIEGNPLVLIVEDNPDNMITAKALLAGKFTIIEAVNGEEGVAMAKKHKPHLILMDIALPDMDGIEAFKLIRENVHLQQIPVIALTASAMTSDRETILAHGLDAYIAKPIDGKIFIETINRILYGI